MAKRDKNDPKRNFEKGAAEARSLMGTSFRGLAQPYARAGREGEKERPEDDDDCEDDREDEISDDDQDEDAEDTKADAEAAAKRGAQTVRNLMGKGVRSSAARSLANIREHRREAKRADGRRVDDALGREEGRRTVDALKRKGLLPGR